MLALSGVPLPAAREAREQSERADQLELELRALELVEAEATRFAGDERRRAAQIAREHRRWFAPRRELLSTRNHVLQLVRVLGIEVVELAVGEPQLPEGSFVPGGGDGGGDASGGDSSGTGGIDGASGAAPTPTAPYAFESVELLGRGGALEVQVLAAVLSKLDPPLRLQALEQQAGADPVEFVLRMERFFEADVVTGADAGFGSQQAGGGR